MAKKSDTEFDIEEMVNEALEITEGSNDIEDDDDGSSEEKSKKKTKELDTDDGLPDGDFMEDYLYSEEPDWKGFRYCTLLGSTESIMNIKFSKFFGKESEDYENFNVSCNKKKAYRKLSHVFCHTMNVILNQNKKAAQNFLYRYYCMKRDLDNDNFQQGNVKQFVSSIVNLFDVEIINEIRKLINENYVETGDIKYKENKDNFIDSITFLDYHIKVLYIVSRMTHFVAPLCIEYLKTHFEADAKVLLTEVFTALFPIAESYGPGIVPISANDRPADVYQKVYDFVQTKVFDTIKSDETMWERQAHFGVNPKITTEQIVSKLIVDIIPEVSFNGNVINMFATVTRKSVLDYTLRKKDLYNINQISEIDNASDDNDNAVVSESDMFDAMNAKHDAFGVLIRHTFTTDTVNKIIERSGVIINPEDVEYYMKNIHFHKFQTFAIFSSCLSAFGGTENLYGLNQENYIRLMLMICKRLEASGLRELSYYISGIKNRHYIAKKESRIFNQQLVADPLYQYIINNKYNNIKNIIDKKNNFISSRISFLTSNEFSYNLPDSNLTGQIIPRNDDLIRQQVLRFFVEFIL